MRKGIFERLKEAFPDHIIDITDDKKVIIDNEEIKGLVYEDSAVLNMGVNKRMREDIEDAMFEALKEDIAKFIKYKEDNT